MNNKLLYQNNYTMEFIEKKIVELDLKGLRIFSSFGESKTDSLNFLKEYSFLKELEIASFSDNKFSFTFLKNLTTLIKLSVEFDGNEKIDFSNQINLEELSIKWRKNIVGLDKCSKIKKININDFFENELGCFKNQILLESLTVKGGNLETLNGLRNNSILKSIVITNNKRLKSVVEINNLKELIYLEINGSSSIKDFNELENGSLKNLLLTDCKNIGSIKFIENFPNIEKVIISGNSRIEDKEFLFKNKINIIYRD